jgi:hypothetical protein
MFGYPITAVLFIGIAGSVTIFAFVSAPLTSTIASLILLTGVLHLVPVAIRCIKVTSSIAAKDRSQTTPTSSLNDRFDISACLENVEFWSHTSGD